MPSEEDIDEMLKDKLASDTYTHPSQFGKAEISVSHSRFLGVSFEDLENDDENFDILQIEKHLNIPELPPDFLEFEEKIHDSPLPNPPLPTKESHSYNIVEIKPNKNIAEISSPNKEAHDPSQASTYHTGDEFLDNVADEWGFRDPKTLETILKRDMKQRQKAKRRHNHNSIPFASNSSFAAPAANNTPPSNPESKNPKKLQKIENSTSSSRTSHNTHKPKATLPPTIDMLANPPQLPSLMFQQNMHTPVLINNFVTTPPTQLPSIISSSKLKSQHTSPTQSALSSPFSVSPATTPKKPQKSHLPPIKLAK